MKLWRQFWQEEDGMGVVEIVMIIAALMCLALLFKEKIVKFGGLLMDSVFKVPTE